MEAERKILRATRFSLRAPAFGQAAAAWIAIGALFMSLGGCARHARQPSDKVYLHRLEAGETLEEVAEDYYGDPRRSAAIEDFNDIRGDTISPGIVVRVPLSAKDIERLDAREKARRSYNEGLELAEKGAYLDAVGRFREALEIDPKFVDAIYNLGVTLQAMKSYEKARENLERAVELRPKNPDYRFALGNSLFHLDDFSKAADAFERVMDLEPENSKALYSLAVCYEKIGENKKAAAAWERFLELDSTSTWAEEARRHLDALR